MEAKAGKATLREQLSALKARLGAQEREQCAAKISQHLIGLKAYDQARCIGLYAPTADEVATHRIWDDAIAKGKRVAYPRVLDRCNGRMGFFAVSAQNELQPGYSDIREPIPPCPSVAADTIDVVCVPGIAFDPQGHRLGRGAGFYDRWLNGYHGTRIGLSYECQIVDALSVEDFDQFMDIIVTEQRVILVRQWKE